MALDSTYAGPNANSYCVDVAEIRSIAALLAGVASLGLSAAGVTAASDAQVEFMAKLAADRVDRCAFLGVKATGNQAREWPRIYTDMPRYNNTGSIPDPVKYAQVADIMVLASDRTDAETMKSLGVSSYSISEQSVSFGGSSGAFQGAKQVSDAAREILRGAGLLTGSVGSVYVSRG